ncbi:hypothetical protein [Gloeocapsopsis dulcis]|uniref:Uncharacterized protein n=1 Tax=Gloeocapsopsis dulcis AAB1 = 1H9 TaxID=1433147 RepID=A0A6N8FZW9_9CHRO|nr:hypothetical protein [Gloeocapsopsis dulcis]MUL38409.1 hypothetical protein [Gloeocapsopsis dulcis AAB1 = 1H9]WNN89195.1 hypothetical protein P0S91_23620 [Gloeocapsopsis dulcis]
MFQNQLHKFMLAATLSVPIVSLSPQSTLAAPRYLEVYNNNDLDIVELYVSPMRSDKWGQDVLGANILPSEGYELVRLVNSSHCDYDIQAIYEDRSSDTGQLNLCEDTSIEFYGYGGDD